MTGNRPRSHGLSRVVAVAIFAHDGPIIAPAHRLKVNDPSMGSVGLKVNEPALPVWSFDVGSLMRSVDRGRSLREHHSMIVRAIEIARAQNGLCTPAHAPKWREDVV